MLEYIVGNKTMAFVCLVCFLILCTTVVFRNTRSYVPEEIRPVKSENIGNKPKLMLLSVVLCSAVCRIYMHKQHVKLNLKIKSGEDYDASHIAVIMVSKVFCVSLSIFVWAKAELTIESLASDTIVDKINKFYKDKKKNLSELFENEYEFTESQKLCEINKTLFNAVKLEHDIGLAKNFKLKLNENVPIIITISTCSYSFLCFCCGIPQNTVFSIICDLFFCSFVISLLQMFCFSRCTNMRCNLTFCENKIKSLGKHLEHNEELLSNVFGETIDYIYFFSPAYEKVLKENYNLEYPEIELVQGLIEELRGYEKKQIFRTNFGSTLQEILIRFNKLKFLVPQMSSTCYWSGVRQNKCIINKLRANHKPKINTTVDPLEQILSPAVACIPQYIVFLGVVENTKDMTKMQELIELVKKFKEGVYTRTYNPITDIKNLDYFCKDNLETFEEEMKYTQNTFLANEQEYGRIFSPSLYVYPFGSQFKDKQNGEWPFPVKCKLQT